MADAAAELRVNIVYHTTEHDGEGVYKKAVVVDGSTGEAVLANYKQHIAPDEELGVSRASRSIVELGDRRVTAYICYDMHYPDVVGRLSGSDVAYTSRSTKLPVVVFTGSSAYPEVCGSPAIRGDAT